MQELISKKYIFTDKEYQNRDAVFEELGKMLIDDGYAKPSYIKALKEREKNFPTGLKTSSLRIAIPHTDASHVLKPCIVVSKLAKPVEFNEMGKIQTPMDVDMIIMLALNDGKKHLTMLQKVISIIGDHELLSLLEKAKTNDEIFEFFNDVLNS